jgi:serine/threonine-protein kinase HipA
MTDLKIIKKMFKSEELPKIDFGLKDIAVKAQEMVGKMSVSGVQPKLLVKHATKGNQLIIAEKSGKFILKPQTQQFSHLPENENLCMTIAAKLNIETPPHCLVKLADQTWAYVIERFDRKGKIKIHQEDFTQILEIKDKYKGSLEKVGEKIKEISSVPGLDAQLFFERVVFNFLIGNGDAHLKNFTMIHHAEKGVRLSPIYDVVCSKLVIPKEEDNALLINGKKNKLKKRDFDALADRLKIPEKIRYESFKNKKEIFLTEAERSELPAELKTKFKEIIEERYGRFL